MRKKKTKKTKKAIQDTVIMQDTAPMGTQLFVAIEIANKLFDGHLTIMKFTTCWRVGFSIPNDRDEINELFEGKTFTDALILAMQGTELPLERIEK